MTAWFCWWWKCPQCGAHNKDDYSLTAEPSCEECGEAVRWADLLGEEIIKELDEELEREEV